MGVPLRDSQVYPWFIAAVPRIFNDPTSNFARSHQQSCLALSYCLYQTTLWNSGCFQLFRSSLKTRNLVMWPPLEQLGSHTVASCHCITPRPPSYQPLQRKQDGKLSTATVGEATSEAQQGWSHVTSPQCPLKLPPFSYMGAPAPFHWGLSTLLPYLSWNHFGLLLILGLSWNTSPLP